MEPVTSGFEHTPEVYREDVGFDVAFCMRVAASREEIARFVDRIFAPEYRLAVHPDDRPLTCPADFWPSTFANATTAYRAERTGDWLYSTQGVIVEDGYLYYWDFSL